MSWKFLIIRINLFLFWNSIRHSEWSTEENPVGLIIDFDEPVEIGAFTMNIRNSGSCDVISSIMIWEEDLEPCFHRYRSIRNLSMKLTIRWTDTAEDSKLFRRRKRPKVDTLFFPPRRSDENDSARSRKYSRPLLNVFACIG